LAIVEGEIERLRKELVLRVAAVTEAEIDLSETVVAFELMSILKRVV